MMGLRMWRLLLAAIGASMLVAAPAHAQFDRLVDALKDKAVDAITQPNQAQPASDEPQAKRARLTIDQGFDFTPGTHVVTAIDFGDSAVGSMPPARKPNGPGQIVAPPELSGKWPACHALASPNVHTDDRSVGRKVGK